MPSERARDESAGRRAPTRVARGVPRPKPPLGTDPDTISTGCPYCLVMLGDAVNAKKSSGEAKESLEVVDVAQLLVRSVALREDTPAPGGEPEPGGG